LDIFFAWGKEARAVDRGPTTATAIRARYSIDRAAIAFDLRHKRSGYDTQEKRMSREKSEPGRVAPVIPGRHGPALMGKRNIYYMIVYKPMPRIFGMTFQLSRMDDAT
jgi:hypothetical protein